jgi:hypothetical protein
VAIAGIPGEPEPCFFTDDGRLYMLDTLVRAAALRMAPPNDGADPRVLKVLVQVARRLTRAGPLGDRAALVGLVREGLRAQRVIMGPDAIEAALVAYGEVVLELEITRVVDSA